MGLSKGKIAGSVRDYDSGILTINAGQESAFLIAHALPTPTSCGFDAIHPWTTLGEMLTYTAKTQNCLTIYRNHSDTHMLRCEGLRSMIVQVD